MKFQNSKSSRSWNLKFQISKSHSGAEIQNSKSHSPELKFKIQNLTLRSWRIQNPPGAGEFKIQNSKSSRSWNFKILSAPELNFKILSAPELNFKILSAPELNFKIQNPLSSGAEFQNLTLRSWNFKIQNSKSHSPELEFQNSKFKILQLRRVKFQNLTLRS